MSDNASIYDRPIASPDLTTMKRADGRGQRSLRTEEDNNDESGCSGQREHESPTSQESPIPTSNDDEATTTAAAMTNERSRTQRRSRRIFISSSSRFSSSSSSTSSSFSPSTSSFYSLSKLHRLSSFSWRHMYYAVFLIPWIVSSVVAAPTDRNERQPTVEVLDGYVNYSINGSSPVLSFQEISRNAFLQLKETSAESHFRTAYQLESTEQEQANHMNHVEHQSHVDHLTRHHRKKNRKPVGKLKKMGIDETEETILKGRKHALLQLANPDGLIMNQRCDGQKFKQRIRVDGCLTKVVVNRLCHGTCASIFIPRMHSKKLKAAFRSCAACAPDVYDYVPITLDCPGRNPPNATKTIVKVKSCKCKEVRIAPF
uniref:Bursicon n=2 Tax=Caenorhabditis tropicalis TaxID=1561998 RepID=A0A1I7UAR9_9PELO